MDGKEIRSRLSQGSGYTDLPGEHVTVNQIVAWNLAYWRKIAGLTQDQLGERLGWSKVVVSAAERSVDGKRIRNFTADDLVNIADALDLPVSALMMPPDDDGNDRRYIFHLRNMDICHNMYDLLGYAISDPAPDDTEVMKRYRERYVAAINFYFGTGPEEDVRYVEDLTTEERIVDRLARLRGQYDALRDILGDNDKTQEVLSTRLGELRQGREHGDAWDNLPPELREHQKALSRVAREMFGDRGLNRAEVDQVSAEAKRRGIVKPDGSEGGTT